MTTSNKRVLVTVKPDTYATLERLAEAQGDPVATCITKILDEQRPILDMMATAVAAAKQGRRQAAMQSLQVMTGKALGVLGEALKLTRGKKKS
ncbi:MAG: hypothetical protein ACREIJ_01985 [Nitrospiraceae bacterium]